MFSDVLLDMWEINRLDTVIISILGRSWTWFPSIEITWRLTDVSPFGVPSLRPITRLYLSSMSLVLNTKGAKGSQNYGHGRLWLLKWSLNVISLRDFSGGGGYKNFNQSWARIHRRGDLEYKQKEFTPCCHCPLLPLVSLYLDLHWMLFFHCELSTAKQPISISKKRERERELL